MRFCKKTIILGGGSGGVLSLERNAFGLNGKLKTALRGDIYLAVLDDSRAAIVSKENFLGFLLPDFDENNLNVYILDGDKIVSHGKTAAVRPWDSNAMDIIRRCRETTPKKKNSENISDALSQAGFTGQTAAALETDKKAKINDFIFDIRRNEQYNDEAIAEVNYYEKQDFSPPSPEIIRSGLALSGDNFFCEAAAVGKAETDLKEIKIKLKRDGDKGDGENYNRGSENDPTSRESELYRRFVFQNGEGSPSAYERGFLSGNYKVLPDRKKESVGIHKKGKGGRKNAGSVVENDQKKELLKPDGGSEETAKERETLKKKLPYVAEKSSIKGEEEPKTLPESEKEIPVIESDFFEEVAAQLKVLMNDYPHNETLEKLIPDSRWVKIPMENGGHYVVGTISDLYIVYGVPGKYDRPPEELKDCSWLPLGEPDGEGYWVLFQDASTGKSIAVDFE